MKKTKCLLRLWLCPIGMALCLPALAEDGSTPLQEVPVPADTARIIDVDEVVVVASPKETARLRRQPLSSTLFGKTEIGRHDIGALPDVSTLAPNFYMPAYGSRITSAVYIRGIGSRLNTPAVGLYVDNVPYIDKSAYDFGFLDVERVDVLRGPQGTLYGRNAMGGLVRVFTADPLTHRGTDVSLGANTRDGGRRVAFTSYLHPGSRSGLSVGAFYNGSEGFFRNSTTGRKADGSDAAGGRMRWVWRLSDRVKVDWTASYEYSDEGACPYFYEGSATPGATAAYPEQVGRITANRESKYRRSLFNTGVGVEWKGRAFTFSSITAFQHLRDRLFLDQDFIAPDIFSLEQKQRIQTLSEEIALKSLPGQRWQWTTGAFLMYQNLRTECPVDFYGDGISYLNGQLSAVFDGLKAENPAMPPMGLAFTGEGLPFESHMRTPSAGAALFHQSTFNDLLVERLSLTMGLRLDYDYRELRLASGTAEPVTADFWMGRPAAAKPLDPVSPTLNGHLCDDSWQLLPKIALQYDLPRGNGNVYASATKGYRAGGYNIQSYSELSESLLQRQLMLGALGPMANAMGQYVPAEPQVASLHYLPEQTWSYEVGAHLSFFDRALLADAAIFYMNTKNQQLARFAENGYGRIMVNAGKSRSCGGELGLRGLMMDGRLVLSANYGYTFATFTEHDLGGGTDYTDNRVPYVPAHTLAAAADFMQPVKRGTALERIGGGIAVSGAGRIYWDEANLSSQPFHAQLEAHLAAELARGIRIRLWAKNLTGTHFRTFAFNSMGRNYAQYGLPRHFGADIALHF